jgi:hypothetical protein
MQTVKAHKTAFLAGLPGALISQRLTSERGEPSGPQQPGGDGIPSRKRLEGPTSGRQRRG